MVTCARVPVLRPRTFVVACADANTSLTGLTWHAWRPGAAAPTGTLVENTCTPSCAGGELVRYPVTVEIDESARTATLRTGEAETPFNDAHVVIWPAKNWRGEVEPVRVWAEEY